MMSPHPQLTVEEVETMVDYILSLDPEKQVEETLLPLSGRLKFDEHLDKEIAGKYILMASYLDEGHPDVSDASLSAIEQIVFTPPKLELEDGIDLAESLGVWEFQGNTL